MSIRRALALALAIAAGTIGACEPATPTQLEIEVLSADLAPGTELRSVQVQAFREGSSTDILGNRPPFDLSDPQQHYSLPGRIVVTAADPRDPRALNILVTANLAGGEAFTVGLTQGFVAGALVRVVVPLASRCRDAANRACGAGTVCGPSGCETPTVVTTTPGADGGTDASSVNCPSGMLACDGTCVDPLIDRNHCGACEIECIRGCDNGHCNEVSADCRAPDPIALGEGPVSVQGYATRAFDGTPGCVPNGANHYVTFTLDAPEIVSVETNGAVIATGFVQDCTTAAVECSQSENCGADSPQAVTRLLGAGPHTVVVSTANLNAWGITITHAPAPPGGAEAIPSGVFTLQGSASTAAPLAGFCPDDGGHPSVMHAYWFRTCPVAAPAMLSASTCGDPGPDVFLQLRHVGAVAPTCVAASACGTQSSLSVDASAPPGLHVLYLTAAAPTAGTYTLRGTGP